MCLARLACAGKARSFLCLLFVISVYGFLGLGEGKEEPMTEGRC